MMGWFEDDFYSTKVSRRESWRIPMQRRLPGWLLPAAGGAAVVAALFLLFGGGSSEEALTKEPQALATMAPLPDASSMLPSPQPTVTTIDPVVSAAAMVSPTIVSIIGSQVEEDAKSRSWRSGAVGLGSGIIYERSGKKVLIVTNNHVVEGYTKLEVITSTGERRKAEVVGLDQITDLAVLEMDGSGIEAIAEFGDSDALKLGETALAVGNPLGLGNEPTVTKGIISSPKRTIPVSVGRGGGIEWEMELIQTDAAINQGSSGGALFNLEGKVVGINTLKVLDMGVEGMGFAIPINAAKDVIGKLVTDKKIRRPYIGVVTQELHTFAGTEALKLPADVKQGIIVIEATGPAKEAGLKTNDVITALDGNKVDSTLALRKYIYGQKKIGDKLEITYYRGSKKEKATVVLGELKE